MVQCGGEKACIPLTDVGAPFAVRITALVSGEPTMPFYPCCAEADAIGQSTEDQLECPVVEDGEGGGGANGVKRSTTCLLSLRTNISE